MSNTLYFGIGLLIGNIVGSFTTYVVTDAKMQQKYEDQYLKDKKALEDFYEKKSVADELIEKCSKLAEEEPEEESDDSEIDGQLDIFQYAEKLKLEGYTNYDKPPKKENSERPSDGTPYIIDPEEAGENDYDLVTLRYWSDGVLTDFDTNEVIIDSEDIIGDQSLEEIFDEDTDSVYVRNDRRLIDYEIIFDERDYISLSNMLHDEWDDDDD